MKYAKNILLAVLLSVFIVNMIPDTSYAAGTNDAGIKTDVVNYPTGGCEVQKTDIIKKYRMYNGKLQYRRWNEATGKWVDPYWINA